MRSCENCGVSLADKRADARFCSKLCRPPCSIAGCDRPSDTAGECRIHAQRRRRHGDPNIVRRFDNRGTDVCTFPGCTNPHDSHGLCRGHRVRQIKHGDPAYVAPILANCTKCGGPRVGRSKTKDLCQKCYKRTYLETNRPRHRAYVNMRRKRVRQATPAWADRRAIVDFYEACPTGMEVDHVLALQGELVSGLHVLENLQYLPITDNRVKGNR